MGYLVGEVHGGILAGAAGEISLVNDAVGLGVRGALVGEGPGELGGGGSIGLDAVVDRALVLGVGAAVDREILREDVDRLVARAAEAVGEDVAGIAVLHAIVIERAGIVLGARGGVGTVIQVGHHDSDACRGHHGVTTLVGINISTDLTAS